MSTESDPLHAAASVCAALGQRRPRAGLASASSREPERGVRIRTVIQKTRLWGRLAAEIPTGSVTAHGHSRGPEALPALRGP